MASFGTSANRYTEDYSPNEAFRDLMAPAINDTTTADERVEVTANTTANSERPERTQRLSSPLTLRGSERSEPIQSQQSAIPAVVSGFDDGIVRLRCRAPSGPITLDVLAEAVPIQLRRFGASVSVRLDRSLGYRRFVVEKRVPEVDFSGDAELNALSERLSALDD